MKHHVRSLLYVLTTVFVITITSVNPVCHSMPQPNWRRIVNPPPDRAPSPLVPTEMRGVCAVTVLRKGTNVTVPPPAQKSLQIDRLHKLTTDKGVHLTGAGQMVAIIDSGVNRNRRLPNLMDGGDYVSYEGGESDCDAHGTLVAGIIGASSSDMDAFIGMAPDAKILSIRQSSAAFMEKHVTSKNRNLQIEHNLTTLSESIVHAANFGATVINISIAICVDYDTKPDLSMLQAAIRYAAVDKNVVIIAAAGNNDESTCSGDNEGYDPENRGDERNWMKATNMILPAYFTPMVCAVGGVEANGQLYQKTTVGPWMCLAAPANPIISLNPLKKDGSLADAYVNTRNTQGGKTTSRVGINGTTFSAAYVSGLAALIRQKYPKLTAYQVITRMIRTAHTPPLSLVNQLGAGIIDPYAALTADLPMLPPVPAGVPSVYLPPPPPKLPPDLYPRTVATFFAIGFPVGLFLSVIIGLAVRDRKTSQQWFN